MRFEIGDIIYMPYDGSRTYFMVTCLSFLDKGEKAFILQLPLTKNPKQNYANNKDCSDLSNKTNNLEIIEENDKRYVELPDSIIMDEEECKFQLSSRWEYGRDLYHGLYYLNETLENPERRLDV